MNRLDNKNGTEQYLKEDAYLRAQKRLKKIKGFYGHAFWYVVINLFIIIMAALNSQTNFWSFGTFSTAFFWGIGLAFHAMGVFGKNLFFSKSWEDRKIREFLEKEEQADKRRFE